MFSSGTCLEAGKRLYTTVIARTPFRRLPPYPTIRVRVCDLPYQLPQCYYTYVLLRRNVARFNFSGWSQI